MEQYPQCGCTKQKQDFGLILTQLNIYFFLDWEGICKQKNKGENIYRKIMQLNE